MWTWFAWALKRSCTFVGHAEEDATLDLPVLHDTVGAMERLLSVRRGLVFGNPEVFHWTTGVHGAHFFLDVL